MMEKKEAELIDFEEERLKRLSTEIKVQGFDPDDPEWLSKLPPGTVFFCCEKNNTHNFLLQEFAIKANSDKTVLLMQVIPDGHSIEVPVIPRPFCRKFKLHEILLTAEEREYLLKRNKEEKGIEVKGIEVKEEE